jgi:membrane-bound serine protease (ClpP class)
VNFYASKLRSLAATHGRNGTWADAAVRRASSRTANEALRQNIADVIAPTLPALLEQIAGRKTVPKGFVLETAGAEVTTVEMGFWKRLLDTLIDPNLIALMLSLGVLGIVVELWNPGLIFPATFGVLSLVIGFYGLGVLPISWAGLLLILAAFAFWITELFIAFSHGALTVAGAVSFVFGSLLLFEPAGSDYQVSLPVALSVAGAISLFFAFALAKVIQIRRRPVSVGTHTLVGARGQVRRDGLVAVQGELWQARDADGAMLEVGEEVEVVDVEGLSLVVRRVQTPAHV